jgi:cytochrome c
LSPNAAFCFCQNHVPSLLSEASEHGVIVHVQKFFATASAIAVLVVAGTPAFGTDNKDLADLQERGRALVTEKCASCHAVERRGASPRADAPAFRTIGRRYPVEALEEALGEGILSGHPDMPEFVFNGEDVGAIISYLKAIQE